VRVLMVDGPSASSAAGFPPEMILEAESEIEVLGGGPGQTAGEGGSPSRIAKAGDVGDGTWRGMARRGRHEARPPACSARTEPEAEVRDALTTFDMDEYGVRQGAQGRCERFLLQGSPARAGSGCREYMQWRRGDGPGWLRQLGQRRVIEGVVRRPARLGCGQPPGEVERPHPARSSRWLKAGSARLSNAEKIADGPLRPASDVKDPRCARAHEARPFRRTRCRASCWRMSRALASTGEEFVPRRTSVGDQRPARRSCLGQGPELLRGAENEPAVCDPSGTNPREYRARSGNPAVFSLLAGRPSGLRPLPPQAGAAGA